MFNRQRATMQLICEVTDKNYYSSAFSTFLILIAEYGDNFLDLIFGGKIIHKVRKKAKIRNLYNQIPHLIQDAITESAKNIKHHIQESQEVSPFPAGDLKAAMNRQDSMTDMKHK